MKIAFVLLLVLLHGCNPVPPPKPVILADGKWSDTVWNKANECAMDAMIRGADAKEIDAMFNLCVFKRGLTI